MMTTASETPMVDQVDRFREALRTAINETVVDRNSNCAEASRRGLRRIAETLDSVSDATVYNLSVLDIATGGLIMEAVSAMLRAVGAGPTLDFRNAAEFFQSFQNIADTVKRRRLN
jgi:hypothetical protein